MGIGRLSRWQALTAIIGQAGSLPHWQAEPALHLIHPHPERLVTGVASDEGEGVD
jgi:hypothetical protein